MTKFIDEGFVYVTPQKRIELGNVDAVANDLVFTAAGSLGQVGIIPQDSKYPLYIISNKQMRARLDQDVALPLYVYYWLASTEMVEYVQSRNTGSSVPLINLSILKSLPIPLPPLPEQKAIAHILGMLDDKIELNRRMNQTLEAMARALFKSWFVDFDPVRAKAQGRDPGLPTDIAALFPDSFEDSQLGEIPKGWRVDTAGNLFDVSIGRTPPRKESHWFSTNPCDVPWMSIRDLGTCGVFIHDVSEYLTAEAVSQFRIRRIPKGTVVVSFKLTVGRVAITDREMLSNEAIAHFNPTKASEMSAAYLYCYLKGFDFESLGSTSSIATAVNSKSIRSIPILESPKPILEAFTARVEPLLAMVRESEHQTRSLTAMRDALLPKLLSGEVRVKDAEKLVEEPDS